MNIVKRGSKYQLIRRVPRRYKSVERRETIWISLDTDSESKAKLDALNLWEDLVEVWKARLIGQSDDAEARFAAARELAAIQGFRYLPSTRVAKLALEERLARVEAIPDPGGNPNIIEAAAILGTVGEPKITVSRALELFWTMAKDRVLGKSEDQLRRWKNPRVKATANFIKAVGDRPLADITPDDMLTFRDWWMERLETEGLNPSSANKDMIHLGDVLKTINVKKRLGLTLPLSDLGFKENDKVTRPPFSSDWIKGEILAPGALAGLDTQARCIVLGMVNTGYRPSEGAALLSHHIRLDTTIPHISIEAEGRHVKSQYAKRTIPLAGVSLEAMRECAGGFPRYRDRSNDLSKIVNDYLTAQGLRETPGHVLYSLRHSFEDRMLAAGVDDRIRRDVLGHRLTRERYGTGASLEYKAQIIGALAF